MRGFVAFVIWAFFASAAIAHDFSGLARVDVGRSQIVDRDGGMEVGLELSQVIPYRVYTLADPHRLIVDFREVDWAGVSAENLMNSDYAAAVRFGVLRPGWSRLVVDLTEPMIVSQAGMNADEVDGTASLKISLQPADISVFREKSGAPPDTGWGSLEPVLTLPPRDVDAPLLVVVDPGHGGIDPGAGHGGHKESDLMLSLGIEVAEALNRAGGVQAILTRDGDFFVPLQSRITVARQSGADLLISLHADALSEGQARGATIYTLSDEASDEASARMAERHERGDILSGLDLSGQDDRVANVLMDLARAETGPQGQRLAAHLLEQLINAGAKMHRSPLRRANLAVLNAADFPSVLIETGFLSNDKDRAMLLDPVQRRPLVDGIVAGVLVWALEEEARQN